MRKDLYVIVEGEIHPFHCDNDYTDLDSIVVYAHTEEHAMELATMYERGEIEPSEIRCRKCSGTHMVLQEKGE